MACYGFGRMRSQRGLASAKTSGKAHIQPNKLRLCSCSLAPQAQLPKLYRSQGPVGRVPPCRGCHRSSPICGLHPEAPTYRWPSCSVGSSSRLKQAAAPAGVVGSWLHEPTDAKWMRERVQGRITGQAGRTRRREWLRECRVLGVGLPAGL
jgi:hypothetical protein